MLPSGCHGGTPNCVCVCVYKQIVRMAEYAVNLDAIGDIRLDAAPQGGVFGALFPGRDKEIRGDGDLVTMQRMEQYINYFLVGVKYLSLMEQNVLNEHLKHMEDSSNDIMKLQTALKKVQTHTGLKEDAFNTEFDLKETTEHLQELKNHHKLLLEQTAKLKELQAFANVENRLKKGVKRGIDDLSKEIKNAQPSTFEMAKSLYGMALKLNEQWEEESNAGNERRKKRRTKK